ncbi:snRNA-activating protein complex subunit isoform X1 [Lycium ferocissimum]|uniref:snRNA-activating protein complex subunit isoform X1 n=1 Tax=Lycium ferocissimum TaxID=112874 RepID=UPI002814FA50|nr:snRNA-activating protein complex subunit isoform X1 [Lycium ferocissimum]XP_059301445.1 snRNA-activating protein complex subunit isoform X1 [Lycium ferocissimum]XP_059301446.1 snRNA-activating protein complex subunit isoform X1 [Lycium ferocissimum]
MSNPEASADENYVSVPRGGPIYISDMVGPLTRVADFEISIFHELERLKAELSSDSLEMFDAEISVEELKIISEEELVAQAFEEAFKDDELAKDSSQTLTEHLGTSRTDNGKSDTELASFERSEREVDSSTIHDPSNHVLPGTCNDKDSDKSKSYKRKRGKNVHQKNAVEREVDSSTKHDPSNQVPPGACNNIGSDKSKSNKRKRGKNAVEREVDSSTKHDSSNHVPPGACNNKGSDKSKSNKRKQGKNVHQKNAVEREVDSSTIHDPSNHVPPGACNNRGSDKGKSNKRKRGKKHHKNAVDDHYIPKVEQLAKVKEKQEEEKAAARLHSFNGSCSSSHSASKSSSRDARMTSLKSVSLGTKVRAANTCEHIPVQFPEVILCVEIYHYKRTWTKTQEFLVLGRQFLTEMRDRIYCITDEIMKKTDKNDPSGYFLVEDVFCNDFRDPSATDYSKPILDWLQESKSEALEKWESIASGELPQKQKALFGSKMGPQLPHFKAIEMQKIRFCDLRFRLGAGYLYCHQGDCKHQVVIRDMRLIHPEDVQNRAAYPLITYQPKLRFQKCSVCKIYRAVKVTVDDKWAAENPCYFCDLCYYMLHYVEGTLLYDDFSVFEYLHE